jgi:homoserine acetyltransferase
MRKNRFQAILLGLMACSVLLAASPSGEEQKFASLGDLRLENGEILRDCRIGYRTFGRLNEDRNNAVLFLTWFNGKSQQLIQDVGRDKMLDPGQYFVVLIDALGTAFPVPHRTARYNQMKDSRAFLCGTWSMPNICWPQKNLG